MFEQAILEGSYAGRRTFAAAAGFAGQAALAALLFAAPLIWPRVLPQPRFEITIATPPAPAPPEHTAAVRPRASLSSAPLFRRDLLIPTHITALPQTMRDATPPAIAGDMGIAGGFGASSEPFAAGLLRSAGPAIQPPAPAVEAQQATEEIQRIAVSSLDPGRLLHLVQPVYPQLAKTAHVSGTVELSAVIGTDGRVRELRVIRGPALLRNAAIEAVRQWIYKPPVLNGKRVELVAPVDVIFRLD
jgi:protein TonB